MKLGLSEDVEWYVWQVVIVFFGGGCRTVFYARPFLVCLSVGCDGVANIADRRYL